MEMIKPTLLILAAGVGSRYGGLKQLDRIGPSGETIIDYSVYDAIRSGFGKVVFIIKEAIEHDFREAFFDRLKDKTEVDYVFQETTKVPAGIVVPADRTKPWGTGHAVLMAAGKINGPFAVINADDFYGRGAFRAIADYYCDWTTARSDDYCMVGFRIANTLSEFGDVSRGVCQPDAYDCLLDVAERTRIAEKDGVIAYQGDGGTRVPIPADTIVSMNFWGFTPSFFGHLERGFAAFIRENAGNLKSEFYIPTMVNELIRSRQATVKILSSADRWFGMTYREDREKVVTSIRELILSGAYPEKLWG